MFSFSPKRAILLALAQVWVIAVGTLGAALVVRLTEEGIFSAYHLPLATVFLVQAGVTFLILPLAWTWAVFYLRIQPEVRLEYKDRVYYVGWGILGILVLFIGFGTLRPVYGFFFEPCAVKYVSLLDGMKEKQILKSDMHSHLTRRKFLQTTSTATVGFWLGTTASSKAARKLSPNEKLNIGVIGTANRAGENLREVSSENIVAICDVDDKFLDAAGAKYPNAKRYNDFRELMDQKDIDAIVVGTPDHTHAVACMAALRSGRHLYCEKPLARTISEVRLITDTARKKKLVTQIGTQIHAGKNYRRVVELVQTGAIGPVAEVHVWAAASYGGKKRPTDQPLVPPNLHYDLWLGPVPEIPYHPEYVPFNWRNWWAFGGGALADFGCHFMDLPYWALDLRYPLSVETEGPPVDADCPPTWLMARYEFPARKKIKNLEQPAVKLTWYHGGKQPSLLSPEQAAKWKSGVMFIGSKGMLLADYGKHVLLPEKDFEGFERPAPYIPDSIGHHKEWIEACKTGGKPTCNFDYSGPLTEAALLGNVAFRTGKKLDWDAKKLRAKNCKEAEEFIQHHYRKGWKI